jgi:hypothetical protein
LLEARPRRSQRGLRGPLAVRSKLGNARHLDGALRSCASASLIAFTSLTGGDDTRRARAPASRERTRPRWPRGLTPTAGQRAMSAANAW